jgi:hypothetical protein
MFVRNQPRPWSMIVRIGGSMILRNSPLGGSMFLRNDMSSVTGPTSWLWRCNYSTQLLH